MLLVWYSCNEVAKAVCHAATGEVLNFCRSDEAASQDPLYNGQHPYGALERVWELHAAVTGASMNTAHLVIEL